MPNLITVIMKREDRINELWNEIVPAMSIRVAGIKAAGVQD